jgi:hypothetical protein
MPLLRSGGNSFDFPPVDVAAASRELLDQLIRSVDSSDWGSNPNWPLIREICD